LWGDTATRTHKVGSLHAAGEHRRFDHGFAVTSHSAQGLTAERVLVHGDTSVHCSTRRIAYVSISRASHEATLFTDDLAKLDPIGSRRLEDIRSGN
jgi:ATP-dependent exoDNAse (exonuclease V) alpha subunit